MPKTITLTDCDNVRRSLPAYTYGDFYVHRTLRLGGFYDRHWSITPKNSQSTAGQTYPSRKIAKHVCAKLAKVPDTDWTGATLEVICKTPESVDACRSIMRKWGD